MYITVDGGLMVKNIKSRILLILLFIILIIVGGLAIHEKLFKVYPEDILKKSVKLSHILLT